MKIFVLLIATCLPKFKRRNDVFEVLLKTDSEYLPIVACIRDAESKRERMLGRSAHYDRQPHAL